MRKSHIDIYLSTGVILGGIFYLLFDNVIVSIAILLGLFLLGLLVKYSYQQFQVEPLDLEEAFSKVTPRDISPFSRFICEIGGADSSILSKFFPNEIPKYSTIGLSILFTGILASCSGGYAIFKIFNNIYFAIALGVLWGLIIFNIDRVMIISISKNQSATQQFLRAIPRFILAIIIAIVISRPIEIRMFENRLNADLAKMEEVINKSNIDAVKSNSQVTEFSDGQFKSKNEVAGIHARSVDIPFAMLNRKDELTSKLSRSQTVINTIFPEVNEFKHRLTDTIEPLLKSEYKVFNELNQKLNYEYKQRKIYKEELSLVSNSIDKIISDFDNQKNSDLKSANERKKYYDEQFLKAENALNARIEQVKAASAESIGKGDFIVMLELFEKKKEEDNSIFWISTFITILFISVEIMPIIAKLFIPKGSYDSYIEFLIKKLETESEQKLNKIKNRT